MIMIRIDKKESKYVQIVIGINNAGRDKSTRYLT